MKKKREMMMIDDEYSGKPYAVLIAVVLGVLAMIFLFCLGVLGLVNLIF